MTQGTKQTTTLQFSVKSYAAWAPGVDTQSAWQAWANHELTISGKNEPPLTAMPSMLRRRANMPGKMALEVAYQVLGADHHTQTLFCSRHGECARAIELLTDLHQRMPLSPTAFSLSVHNAPGGLFSIARRDHTNQLALAAGESTIENAVIEACSLLADGETSVLLVAYDATPPSIFSDFQEVDEQPYAWAWLIERPTTDIISLSWSAAESDTTEQSESAGLQILRFFLTKKPPLHRCVNGRHWQWTHHD